MNNLFVVFITLKINITFKNNLFKKRNLFLIKFNKR